MRRRGFTLIELLVVISIIALLSSVVIATLNTAREKGRIAAGKQFDANIYHAAADSAVAVWDFDECSGTVASDRSGNGNDGALISSPSYQTNTPSGQGCALSLNGSSQYVDFGNTSAFDFGNTSFTVSAWVKLSTTGSYARIMSNGNFGWTTGWLFHAASSWSRYGPDAGLGSGSAASSVLFQSQTALIAGRWSHVAMVFDQTAKIARIYIDGQQMPITKYPGSCGTVTGSDLDFSACSSVSGDHSANTNIGRWSGTGVEYLSVSLDDIRIYNKSLTAQEVGALYASERSTYLATAASR